MKEQELFDYLKATLYPDLEKSPGIFDAFDCISIKACHYIELKCRHTHYPTLLIEEVKYRKLITQSAERDLIPYYINSTPQGIYSFDLMDLPEPEWVLHYMPVTSEFANRSRMDKSVGYLDISEAVQLWFMITGATSAEVNYLSSVPYTLKAVLLSAPPAILWWLVSGRRPLLALTVKVSIVRTINDIP